LGSSAAERPKEEKEMKIEEILDEKFCWKCGRKVEEVRMQYGVRACKKCGSNLDILPKKFLRKCMEVI